MTPPNQGVPDAGIIAISTLRSVLDDAANQIADRTPAIKAKMAETILRAASEGITDPEVLKAAAIEDGMRSAD
jgi:hypothetical protein